METLDSNPFKSLGNFKWIIGNDLLGRKIASFQPDTFTVNYPNGGDYFKHG
jgi:hypothetical protein